MKMKTEKDLKIFLDKFNQDAVKKKKKIEQERKEQIEAEKEHSLFLKKLISSVIAPALNPVFKIIESNGHHVDLPKLDYDSYSEVESITFSFGVKTTQNYFVIYIWGTPSFKNIKYIIKLGIGSKVTLKRVTIPYSKFTKEFIRSIVFNNLKILFNSTVLTAENFDI